MMDRQFRQRLAVEADTSCHQTENQFAVAKTTHAASRIDADDPQATELALAHPTVAVSVSTCPQKSYGRLAVKAMTAGTKALGQATQPGSLAKDCFATTSAHD
jgi:hypothetical protein